MLFNSSSLLVASKQNLQFRPICQRAQAKLQVHTLSLFVHVLPTWKPWFKQWKPSPMTKSLHYCHGSCLLGFLFAMLFFLTWLGRVGKTGELWTPILPGYSCDVNLDWAGKNLWYRGTSLYSHKCLLPHRTLHMFPAYSWVPPACYSQFYTTCSLGVLMGEAQVYLPCVDVSIRDVLGTLLPCKHVGVLCPWLLATRHLLFIWLFACLFCGETLGLTQVPIECHCHSRSFKTGNRWKTSSQDGWALILHVKQGVLLWHAVYNVSVKVVILGLTGLRVGSHISVLHWSPSTVGQESSALRISASCPWDPHGRWGWMNWICASVL